MALTSHATVLIVDDVAKAAAYYRDALGFSVDLYEANPRHYAYANRDQCWLHFACVHGAAPRPNSVAMPPDMFDVYVYVDDVEALYAELVERGAEILAEPIEQTYGLREFRVRDPFGHVLAFGQLREA